VSSEALAGAEASTRVPLGQLLIQGGFLTQVQLDDALYEGSRTGERLGEVVVRRGLASEDDVAQLLAEQWELEYVERSAIWFDGNALARLSREDAQRLEALPTRIEGGHVVVAVAEPTEQRIEALRDLIGPETVVIVVPKSALDAGLRSDLLRSARGQFSPSDGENDAADHDTEPDTDGDSEPELPPAAEEDEEIVLAEVTPFPVQRAEEVDVDTTMDSDAVALLADEAEAVAERLAAQAVAVRAQQSELRERSDAFESRIRELEETLERRDEQLGRVRSQLSELLGSFDD
jgi:hypothetical protein